MIYYRLIALWALAEAMLGGIIHGLKIPVSGLVVGSCAVICICLIAWYVPAKGAIIKATVIVAVFKMLLSPQAPPPAYIAVFFQGLMGELLFWNRRFFRVSCIILAVLALLESGFQRILMLTIVYGNDLWKVINDFVNGLTRQKTTTNYSLLIGGGYVALHLVVGLFIGWWAGGLPERTVKWREKFRKLKQQVNTTSRDKIRETSAMLSAAAKPKKRFKTGLFVIWLVLLGLYIQSYFKIGTPLLPAHISLKILLRSLIIILTWYFLAGPLLKRLLHFWLRQKQTQSQVEIRKVLELLPNTQQLVRQSWKETADRKGLVRLMETGRFILANALDPDQLKQVVILSGPVQTGKTTSLVLWSREKNDMHGILTPVIEGKRVLMNVHTRSAIQMEAGPEEKDTVVVGKFVFSSNNFNQAIEVVRDAISKDGWLIIDEIGLIELRGEGFAEVLKEALASGNKEQKIMLIVREGLVEKVKEFFHLKNALVIRSISEINQTAVGSVFQSHLS